MATARLMGSVQTNRIANPQARRVTFQHSHVPTASNVITMPDPSNKNSAESPAGGHRSTQRGSTVPALKPETQPGSARIARALDGSLRRVRSRARDSGLRHGEVFPLGAFDEGVAARDQHAEGGEVPQHVLLPVRTPLDRRSGAHRAGDRAPVDSRRDRTGRRAALGRAGALDALSGLPQERILHARLRIATTKRGSSIARRSIFCSPSTTRSRRT